MKDLDELFGPTLLVAFLAVVPAYYAGKWIKSHEVIDGCAISQAYRESGVTIECRVVGRDP